MVIKWPVNTRTLNFGPMGCVYLNRGSTWKRLGRGTGEKKKKKKIQEDWGPTKMISPNTVAAVIRRYRTRQSTSKQSRSGGLPKNDTMDSVLLA